MVSASLLDEEGGVVEDTVGGGASLESFEEQARCHCQLSEAANQAQSNVDHHSNHHFLRNSTKFRMINKLRMVLDISTVYKGPTSIL